MNQALVKFSIMFGLAVFITAIYFVVRILGRKVTPSFSALEIESNRYEATAIIRRWKSSGKFGFAVGALLLDLFFFIPTYLVVGFILAVIAGVDLTAQKTSALDQATVLFIPLITIAAIVNIIQDLWLATWLLFGKARGAAITSILGWTKFGIGALSIIYALLWLMIKIHKGLDSFVKQWHVMTAMFLLMAIVAILFARRATKLSKHKPSLLALSLAPNGLAAKDVIEQWGERGKQLAVRALELDALLAVIYGLVLASLCSNYVLQRVKPVAEVAVYVALAAAALHLAQNFGAYVALRSEPAGWWITLMRKIGWTRITMLLLVTLFYCAQAYVYLVDKAVNEGRQQLSWVTRRR